MPLTDIVMRILRGLQTKKIAGVFESRKSAQLIHYLQDAQRFLEEGSWRSANDSLELAEFYAHKSNPKVRNLRRRACQMGLEHEMKYVRAALAELLYHEKVIDAQEVALRQAESGSLASLMRDPQHINELDHTWVISALSTAKELANTCVLKLPDDYSALEREAYSIAVSRNMREAQAAIGRRDYIMASCHLGNAQRNADKSGTKVPSNFGVLQRTVDFYVRPEKLVSEDVKKEYDTEFNRYEKYLIQDTNLIEGIKCLAYPEISEAIAFSGLRDMDIYDICESFLMQLKIELRDRYFRSRLEGAEHTQAFEDSIRPLRDIITSVRLDKALPYNALADLVEVAESHAIANAVSLEGP